MPRTQVTESACLTLLGGWQMALVERRSAEPDYEKGRALLAYLAIEDQLHSREELSELFWPGAAAGRANLRQVLANLRAVLHDDAQTPYILVKRDTLRINPQGRLRLDVLAFNAATTADTSLAQLEKMVALYQGEFMAGFSLPDCPDFEDWLRLQRAALKRRALALLEQLATGVKLGQCRAVLADGCIQAHDPAAGGFVPRLQSQVAQRKSQRRAGVIKPLMLSLIHI